MALVGSLSLMLVHDRFVENPRLARPLEPTRVVVGDHVEMFGHAPVPGA